MVSVRFYWAEELKLPFVNICRFLAKADVTLEHKYINLFAIIDFSGSPDSRYFGRMPMNLERELRRAPSVGGSEFAFQRVTGPMREE